MLFNFASKITLTNSAIKEHSDSTNAQLCSTNQRAIFRWISMESMIRTLDNGHLTIFRSMSIHLFHCSICHIASTAKFIQIIDDLVSLRCNSFLNSIDVHFMHSLVQYQIDTFSRNCAMSYGMHSYRVAIFLYVLFSLLLLTLCSVMPFIFAVVDTS